METNLETIKHLQKSDVVDRVATLIAEINPLSKLTVVPDGFELRNMECFMLNRDDYRFGFKTKSIPDFVAYSQEFDEQGAKCFIDSDRMNAAVILDLGTKEEPLHQRHTANLELNKTAAFIALLLVNGSHLAQKDAANFLEDWADNVKVETKTGESMTIMQASKQLRELSIEQVKELESNVGDFGESMTSMEKIEAKNQDKIPAKIVFSCDPYHGLQDREFDLRVSIITGDSKPKIGFRIVRLEAQVEDMATEFKERLVEEFKDNMISTFIGLSK